MARRNRRVEPDGVRPSSRLAHGMADWRRRAGRAGRRAGRRGGKDGTVPHGPPPGFFVCFFFRGVSAGRGRRTSGVDGADIGCRSRHVKEKYRKKGNNFGRSARRPLPIATPDGAERRSGVQGPRAKAVPDGSGPRIGSGAAIVGVCRRSAKPGGRGRLWSPDRPRGASGAARMEARRIALSALNYFRPAVRRGIPGKVRHIAFRRTRRKYRGVTSGRITAGSAVAAGAPEKGVGGGIVRARKTETDRCGLAAERRNRQHRAVAARHEHPAPCPGDPARLFGQGG